MATYKVVNEFKDSTQKGQVYKVGDKYPKGKQKPAKDRIELLLNNKKNKYNKPFIEEVKEEEKTSNSKPSDSDKE